MVKKTLSTITAALFAVTLGCSSTKPDVIPEKNYPQKSKSVQKSLEEISKSVFCVRTITEYMLDDPKGPVITKTMHSYGTAFAYAYKDGYTYLVTNAHVIDEPQTLTDINPFGQSVKYRQIDEKSSLVKNKYDTFKFDDIKVEEVIKNTALDVAILRTKEKLPVSKAYTTDFSIVPKVNEDVFIIGYPRGILQTTIEGEVANPSHSLSNKPFVFLDATATFGNSGSPYFIRRDNDLYWAGMVGNILPYKKSGVTLFSLGKHIKKFSDMLSKPIKE